VGGGSLEPEEDETGRWISQALATLEPCEVNARWKDIPFAPRRWPFFYGWVILAASTVGILASIPGQTMGVSVFTDYLIAALRISRVQLSTAYMFGTIASSFMLPFAGRLLDRIGARTMVVVAAAGLGAGLLGLSQSDRVVGVAASRSFMLAMSVSTLCFLLIRFFGQGCLTMVSRVTIGKWFNHRRGLATAISGIFVSFGFNGSPLILNRLVEVTGWRGGCLILAALVGLGMSLLGWIFYRDNPEECGLVMDGVTDEAWHRKMAARVPDTRKQFTREEAIRTLPFWAFNLGVASQGLIITAMTFHIVSLGKEVGLSRPEAYSVFLPMSFFSIGANFLGGWVSDRIKLKWLLIVMMAAQAIGTTGLMSFGEPIGRGMLTVGYGVAGGLFGTIVTVTWPRFFGRKHLGAISGLNLCIMMFASAMGPVVFSLAQNVTGSYLAVELLCWFMPLAIIFAGLKAENPQEKLGPA
jgi:OFA family oxalate/formate antiporter-like MFS transporter